MKDWGRLIENYNVIDNDYWPVYLGNGSIGGIFGFFGTQEGKFERDMPFFPSPFIPYIYHDAVWNSVGERVPLGRLRGFFGDRPDHYKDISEVKQTLDIEDGTLVSEGKVKDVPYSAKTFIHRKEDLICLRLEPGCKCAADVFFELKSPFGKKEVITENGLILLYAEMEGWHLAVGLTSSSLSSKYVGYNNIGIRSRKAVDVFLSFAVARAQAGAREKKKLQVVKEARQRALRAGEKGIRILEEEQKMAWSVFWNRSFVHIPDLHLEKFYHASLFYLAQSIGHFGVSPVGLAVNVWHGCRFHDDVFMQMGLWFSNHEREASKISEFRIRTAPAAKRLAGSLGFKGMVYPMEGDGFGNERTYSPFLYMHTLCTGLISNDIWNQFVFKNDDKWLRKIYPVLLGIAEYLTEVIIYDKKLKKYKLGERFTEARNSFGINPVEDSGNVKKALESFYLASKCLGKDNAFARKVKRVIDNWSLPNDGSKYIFFEEERDSENNLLPKEGLKVRCGGQYHLLFPMQTIHHSDPLLPETFNDAVKNLNYLHLPAFHLGTLATVAGLLGKPDEALAIIKKIARKYIMSHYVLLESPGEGAPYVMTNAGTVVTAILSLFFYSNYDEVLLFHAVPTKWKDIEFKDLRSHHALLVSGKMKKAKVEHVRIVNISAVKVNKKLSIHGVDSSSTYMVTVSERPGKTKRRIIRNRTTIETQLRLEPGAEYILEKQSH